jgi:hypothetical protein
MQAVPRLEEGSMSRKIFISYRRDDAKAEARSIYQHLARIYGRDQIFMDVDSIQKGLDFTKVLGRSLSETSVMLVVMGRTWLSRQDENGVRRLDDPADYVRLEIATALQRDIPVIPVRVDGARLPRTEELPDDLKSLVRRQGTAITHENFDSDVRGLEADLKQLVAPVGPRRFPVLPVSIGAAALLALIAGGGIWWTARSPENPRAASALPAPRGAAQEAALREAAATVLRQQQEERERKEAEVRRRVDEEMTAEARRKAEAARAAAEAEARRQAEESAKRQMERARLEAEAEALRIAKAEQERIRKEQAAQVEAQRAKAQQAERERREQIAAAWASARATNTLQSYLDYLRSYRDGGNREEARRLARPLLLASIEEQADAHFTGRRRPDGTLSYYEAYPNNPRAAAACIDWKHSTPAKIWFIAKGVSGHRIVSPIAEREEQALGICRSTRREGSNCTCEIVRRNRDSTLKVPDDWIARQLD